MEQWELITALLPSGIELIPNEDEAIIKNSEKSIKVIRANDNSYVVNGHVVTFEDSLDEIVNTLLIPYILQELDGEKRI